MVSCSNNDIPRFAHPRTKFESPARAARRPILAGDQKLRRAHGSVIQAGRATLPQNLGLFVTNVISLDITRAIIS
jgi:hypothetical protein